MITELWVDGVGWIVGESYKGRTLTKFEERFDLRNNAALASYVGFDENNKIFLEIITTNAVVYFE